MCLYCNIQYKGVSFCPSPLDKQTASDCEKKHISLNKDTRKQIDRERSLHFVNSHICKQIWIKFIAACNQNCSQYEMF